MTLYYDSDTDTIIENHPEYIEINAKENTVTLHMSDLSRGEKRSELVDAAVNALDASPKYEVTQGVEYRWVPEDER